MTTRTYLPFALLLALLFTAGSCIHAQWSVGGILGMNFSSFGVSSDETGEDYSGLTGIVLGALVDYELSENMGLRSGLVFIGKGGKLGESGNNFKLRNSYLEIPILFRYFFPLSSTDVVVPYATAGPSVGFRTGAKAKYGGGEFDRKDEVNGIDFGISFGAGVNVPLDDLVEGLVPFFEIRYSLGIANTNAEVKDDPDEVKVRNNGLLLTIGATIPIGG